MVKYSVNFCMQIIFPVPESFVHLAIQTEKAGEITDEEIMFLLQLHLAPCCFRYFVLYNCVSVILGLK